VQELENDSDKVQGTRYKGKWRCRFLAGEYLLDGRDLAVLHGYVGKPRPLGMVAASDSACADVLGAEHGGFREAQRLPYGRL